MQQVQNSPTVRYARMVGIKHPLEYLVISPSIDQRGFLRGFRQPTHLLTIFFCHLSKPDDPNIRFAQCPRFWWRWRKKRTTSWLSFGRGMGFLTSWGSALALSISGINFALRSDTSRGIWHRSKRSDSESSSLWTVRGPLFYILFLVAWKNRRTWTRTLRIVVNEEQLCNKWQNTGLS